MTEPTNEWRDAIQKELRIFETFKQAQAKIAAVDAAILLLRQLGYRIHFNDREIAS